MLIDLHLVLGSTSVIEQVAFDPVYIGLFGAVGVMLEANGFTHYV